jgi:ABC-type antimicrobial peptide transport system permease subunit
VIADLRYGGLSGEPRPEVFLPFGQSPQAAMTYVVRTGQDPAAAVNAVKRAVWAVDPLQTFYEAGAIADMVGESLRPRLFVLRLALCFAGVGFVLAIAGAYGAVAWSLRRRTSEFGVRMALGASGARIRRHMLGYAARLAATGIAIGVACALLLGELLRAFLFELSATDPLTIVSISGALMAAVLAASAVPARRASKIDPVIALRN